MTATPQQHEPEEWIGAPVDELVALLEVWPRPWLGEFLRIAALTATADLPSSDRAHGWYRTGRAERRDPGGTDVSLVWSPNVGGVVFTQFTGRIVARQAPDGTVLALRGDTDGGSADRNSAVLRRLLQLIGAAIGADHRPVGR